MTNLVITEVRKLAQEKPDFNYSAYKGGEGDCSYVGVEVGRISPEGGCIVGQAILRAELAAAEDLADWEHAEQADTSVSQLIACRPEWVDTPNNRESEWLSLVQSQQDTGFTWKNAVHAANVAIPGV